MKVSTRKFHKKADEVVAVMEAGGWFYGGHICALYAANGDYVGTFTLPTRDAVAKRLRLVSKQYGRFTRATIDN
jgi:hypothetical protein